MFNIAIHGYSHTWPQPSSSQSYMVQPQPYMVTAKHGHSYTLSQPYMVTAIHGHSHTQSFYSSNTGSILRRFVAGSGVFNGDWWMRLFGVETETEVELAVSCVW